MKKVTVIIWAIIIIIIAVFFYDNWTFFSENMSPNIRFVTGPIKPIPTFVYFIIFFFFGFIIAYLFNFSTRFKAKRTAKKLNAAITAQEGEIGELKRELNTLKGPETPAVDQATENKTDTDAIIELTGDKLVETPADQTDKSSLDKQEANLAKDSEDKASKKKS
jgi:uncharacterized integral membrane protein